MKRIPDLMLVLTAGALLPIQAGVNGPRGMFLGCPAQASCGSFRPIIGRPMALVHDHVRWRGLVLPAMNLPRVAGSVLVVPGVAVTRSC